MAANDAALGRQVIFLDFPAVMGYPDLLVLNHPDFSFWITPSIVKAIEGADPPMRDVVKNKLADALQSRRVSYNPVDFTDFSPLPNMYGSYADVLKHAATSKESGDQVTIVTVDSTMRQGAEALGVNVVDPDGLRALISAAVQADEAAKLGAERERKRQGKLIWGRVIMGLMIAAAGIAIWDYRAPIIKTITVYGVLGLVAVVGFGLYALRGRYRFIYGVAETAVGYFTAARIVFPTDNIYSIGLVEGIGLLGGLYIIVRGLDNVGKGLEKTPYQEIWRRYSGEANA